MKVIETALSEVNIIEPDIFGDERGFFMESFSAERYREQVGIDLAFVQDNISRSSKGVLRGMHHQRENSQGKLVSVSSGAVFDVAVDIRVGSPTFGKWVGVELTDQNRRQLWVPPGFAHGFVVLSETADFTYKCTNYYHPASEISLLWNDADVAIDWPELGAVSLSQKDKAAKSLRELEAEGLLPAYKKAL